MLRHPERGVGFYSEVPAPERLCRRVAYAITCSGGPAAYRLRRLLDGAPPAEDRHSVGSRPSAAAFWPHGFGSRGARKEVRGSVRQETTVLSQPLVVPDRFEPRTFPSHSCRSMLWTAMSLLIFVNSFRPSELAAHLGNYKAVMSPAARTHGGTHAEPAPTRTWTRISLSNCCDNS
jgi:hypothetical protein